MKKKGFKLLLLMLFASSILKANYRSEIYSAFISNKMQDWKGVIDRMEAVSVKSDEFLLEVVNYHYGYIAWCLGIKKSDEARKYLAMAEKDLEVLSANNKNSSMVNSYKSAFYGYRIALNKLNAPFLGPKSLQCAWQAVKTDHENPFGYLQLGNTQFYKPRTFGGSKKEALGYYLTAMRLMEKDKANTETNWNYLSILTLIAQSYYYTGDYKSSVQYLDRILEIEPGYLWVKNELYQQVLKKMKG